MPRSYFQLAVLVAAHFCADMFGGLLPGFLPVLRQKFSLSIGEGVLLLAVLGIGSNFCQIPVGMLRKNQKLPRFIQYGMALGTVVLIFGMLPVQTNFAVLLACVLVTGIGIAMVHPEGLRSTLAIKTIPATVSTSCFMVAGFFGCASGAFIGAALVGAGGFPMLLWLLLLPALLIYLISAGKFRLAVERNREKNAEETVADRRSWSFYDIFWIAVFMNTGASITQGLLPSYLNECGFSLTFSGLSAMFFGVGTVLGALSFGMLARRVAPAKLILGAMALGVPVVILYFHYSTCRAAFWLLPVAGFLLNSGFPLMVAMSRTASGKLPLGMRLGVIVGGTWTIGTALLLGVGQLADRIGLAAAMNFVWISFAVALLIGGVTLWRRQRRGAGNR